MRKKFAVSPEERELFRRTIGDVQRLPQDRISPPHTPVPPRPQQRQRDEEEVVRDMLSDALDPAELETGEELLFARPGLQHGVMRKLRRGQYSLGAELDLHGMTVAVARQALAAFLTDCLQAGIRNVRIIHGKGNRSLRQQPVLKAKVNHWLRQRDEVLAFCSARPVDGGTGAIYVLLRNRR